MTYEDDLRFYKIATILWALVAAWLFFVTLPDAEQRMRAYTLCVQGQNDPDRCMEIHEPYMMGNS